jgi:hypothetical protein
MHRPPFMLRLAAETACFVALAMCAVALARASEQPPVAVAAAAYPQDDQGLVIENRPILPEASPHHAYAYSFHAHGGSRLRWKVENGPLPPGMQLEASGRLHGEPTAAGEFQFTVSVVEAGRPESAVQKGFVLRVTVALAIDWKDPAHVNGNRIEGSIEVTNGSHDDMDLTFIAMAVAGNGRATAIGYQHFVLRSGAVAQELPFGDTLPYGGYVVHVDVVGEVAGKKQIYRERLQTPRPLQVNVGP